MVNAPAYPYPVHNVTLFNNAHIAYMDEGQGDHTLLFIHGLANYAASWQPNIETLKSSFRCVAIDLPGNGLSENVTSPYSVSFFAKCIIDVIGRLALRNVTIVGHSMGGQVAITAALTVPGCCEGLVLCAPAGFEQFSDMEKMLYQSSMQYAGWFSNDENNLQQTLYNSFYQYPKAAEKMLKDLVNLIKRQNLKDYRRMLDQCVSSMLTEPVHARLKDVTQKTLVMFGEYDGLIPNRILHPVSTKSIGSAGTKLMPNARLEMIKGCGHFLQWEKAATVNSRITAFVKNEI